MFYIIFHTYQPWFLFSWLLFWRVDVMSTVIEPIMYNNKKKSLIQNVEI